MTQQLTGNQSKILLLVTRGTVGGAQMSVLELARGLVSEGREVTVAFGDGQFLAQECQQAGIPTIRFRSLRRTLNPWPNLVFVWQMKKLLDRGSYDVLHINSSNALFAAIGARLSRNRPRRVVFTFRGLSVLDRGYRNWLVRWFYQLVFRFFMLFVDVPVFVSQANYQAARTSRLVRAGKVVYNGLNPDRLSFLEQSQARTELAQHLGRSLEGKLVVGTIGRLAYQKNYSFLIEQIAGLADEYPDLLLVIVGDGPERSTLTKLIEHLNLTQSVVLAGEIPQAYRYLKAFDIFVLPSRYEGLSITLIEALFAGVPVLASDVGGAREQFAHAPFQVYPLGDRAEFQKRLTRLIENPTVRGELVQANRDRSSEYTIARTVRDYLKLYCGQKSF